MPCGASVSGASGPPGLAATGIMGAPRNLRWKNKQHHQKPAESTRLMCSTSAEQLARVTLLSLHARDDAGGNRDPRKTWLVCDTRIKKGPSEF